MRFDVPFLPEPGYARFLSERDEQLESVHFGLGSHLLPDARPRLKLAQALDVVENLNRVFGPDKYLLLNACFHDERQYRDSAHLKAVTDLLRQLLEGAELTGVVFVDPYMLRALHDHSPSLCSMLEAVPSVNCMLDHEEKVAAYLRVVDESGFRRPARVILDRSLNRRPRELERVVQACRSRFHGLRLGLLANEGCLPHCPYKRTHDALIALGHLPGQGDRTFGVNRDLGCIRTILEAPERIFSSPFIRPEDVVDFEGMVDLIKVCGRERGGVDFLRRAVSAYLSGEYSGNLLSILDTLGEFEARFYVPNQDLPADLHHRLCTCSGDCRACGWCAELYHELVREQDMGMLADLRATQARS
ncbi:MAG: hypothetical protein V3573_11960 [Desulfovibrionaceae bacterium]